MKLSFLLVLLPAVSFADQTSDLFSALNNARQYSDSKQEELRRMSAYNFETDYFIEQVRRNTIRRQQRREMEEEKQAQFEEINRRYICAQDPKCH